MGARVLPSAPSPAPLGLPGPRRAAAVTGVDVEVLLNPDVTFPQTLPSHSVCKRSRKKNLMNMQNFLGDTSARQGGRGAGASEG